ncbi:hypothetical protein GQ43DRAFT_466390 [Delitschia confertaspora ATCC 74209]|uniref:Uncharacterized protein n=1 Tax=Delitschia confertaspora ATCC 74209 TaxID=1513339 RepID=A0A9P4JDI7_9PLEO|nr:hypothetical protein GQ43DRAFT_466390 [Delitschia confertaspora ATCC 74209]
MVYGASALVICDSEYQYKILFAHSAAVAALSRADLRRSAAREKGESDTGRVILNGKLATPERQHFVHLLKTCWQEYAAYIFILRLCDTTPVPSAHSSLRLAADGTSVHQDSITVASWIARRTAGQNLSASSVLWHLHGTSWLDKHRWRFVVRQSKDARTKGYQRPGARFL